MKARGATLLCVVPLLYGCATIMQGTTQDVGIASSPSGARVTINGRTHGVTPAIVDLRRKDNHVVTLELEGYETYQATLTRRTSGWVWGNIVFGGIPGLAIDAITGGLYRLTPEQIEAQLRQGTATGELHADTLYITVVLSPDPAWEPIASLEPRR